MLQQGAFFTSGAALFPLPCCFRPDLPAMVSILLLLAEERKRTSAIAENESAMLYRARKPSSTSSAAASTISEQHSKTPIWV